MPGEPETASTPPPEPNTLAAPLGEGLGGSIGPYKLMSVVGEGGFGIVYLAERREPFVQRVALKVIKPGMDSRAVIARFEQERQALAVMDHPNVAKVLDGGITQQGRPYFVMEHVQGEAITEYCDRHTLSLRQRLELFIPVCEAVQHAHMKGIIHRDLKPSNILVSVRDERAIPKVIDFGIAKAISHTLTEKTIFTEQGQLIGTPEYMSPEQAEMGATDIDTRTDVYSLGVVLYELLTGLLPFDPKALRSAGLAEIQRIIREEEPPRPSTKLTSVDDPTGREVARRRQAQREAIVMQLRRELEWVPLKAIRKDRRERYRGPADLADDLRNYLAGLPLRAGPVSVAYRARKLFRRHRGPALFAAAVVLSLLGGVIGTTWGLLGQRTLAKQAMKAKVAADKATARAEASERVERAKRQEAELASYHGNLYAAKGAFEHLEPAAMRARLDDCPGHLRGWEWRHLDAESDSAIRVLRGHSAALVCAEISPDGLRALTGSEDGTVRLWDVATGLETAALLGHDRRITSAHFSADGTRVVTAADDDTVRVWDAGTGTELASLPVSRPLNDVCAVFHPAGTQVLIAEEGGAARLWDFRTGRTQILFDEPAGSTFGEGVLAEFSRDGEFAFVSSYATGPRLWAVGSARKVSDLGGPGEMVTAAAFRPDGRFLLTATSGGAAMLWNTDTGREVAAFRGHEGAVWCVAFSPDGIRYVTASQDKTARIWQVGGGDPVVLRGHAAAVTSVAFSGDGSRILTASADGTARLWNTATGTEAAALRGHLGAVEAAVFGEDLILTASADTTARIWDAGSIPGPTTLRRTTTQASPAAVFSPDGSEVLTADVAGRLWDTTSGAALSILRRRGEYWSTSYVPGSRPIPAFSPDGSLVMVAKPGDDVRVWDALTGREVSGLLRTPWVNCAVFSPDGKRVVTAADDGTARIWDTTTWQEVGSLRGHTGPILWAEFAPDSGRLLTSSRDTTARSWDVATGATLAELRGHTSHVRSAVFDAAGSRVVTASDDSTARVWDAASGRLLATLAHDGPVASARFNAAGDRVVTASKDSTARVWDASGRQVAVLRGHEGPVSSAVFSADGSRVLTASADRTARLWDGEAGRELLALRQHEGAVTSAVFSPIGDSILTSSVDGSVRLWSSIRYRDRYPDITALRFRIAKSERILGTRLKAQTVEEAAWDLLHDPSLDKLGRAAIRAAVMSELDRRKHEAMRLHSSAWPLVITRSTGRQELDAALSQARRALELEPLNPLLVRLVGVAEYRGGNYEAALESLLRLLDPLELLYGAPTILPIDLAFVAMAQARLGQDENARLTLGRLRELITSHAYMVSDEVKGSIAEAEELIGQAPKP